MAEDEVFRCDVLDLLDDCNSEQEQEQGSLAARWAASLSEDEEEPQEEAPKAAADDSHSLAESTETAGLSAQVESLITTLETKRDLPVITACLGELLRLSSTHEETPALIRRFHGTAALLRLMKSTQDEAILEIIAALMANCGGAASRGAQTLTQSFDGVALRIHTPSFVDGGLGWQVWPAARMLGEWIVQQPEAALGKGQTVLELAAGLGVPGILSAKLGAGKVHPAPCCFEFSKGVPSLRELS